MPRRPYKLYYTINGKQHKKAFSSDTNARYEFEFRKRAGHTPAHLSHEVYHEPGIESYEDMDFDEDMD